MLIIWFVCSLVTETKKDGLVDVTQAYNKIINSIKEAEEAAKMANKAANDTMEVQDTRVYVFTPIKDVHYRSKVWGHLEMSLFFKEKHSFFQ